MDKRIKVIYFMIMDKKTLRETFDDLYALYYSARVLGKHNGATYTLQWNTAKFINGFLV